MFCRFCGNNISDNSATCPNCGAPLDSGMSVQGGMNPGYQSFNQIQTRTVKPLPILSLPTFLCLGATAIFFISCLLPFVKADVLGIKIEQKMLDGWDHDGIFVVALSIIGALFVLARKYTGFIVVSVLSVALTLFEWSDTDDKLEGVYGSLIEKGSGYYLMMVGAVAMVIAGIVSRIYAKNQQLSSLQ